MKRIVVMLLTGGLLGCPGPGPGDGPDDLGGADMATPDGGQDGGGDPSGPRFDRFAGTVNAVAWRAPYGPQNAVSGAFFDGVPEGFHQEAMRIGDCRLLTFKPALCDAGCQGVCVERNVCRPFPQQLSAGTVRVDGLRQPVRMDPMAGNSYYPAEPLQGDLFVGMNEVRAQASGGAFPAFLVQARPVAAFQTPAIVNDEIRLRDEEDYVFTWTPGGDPGARVRLVLNANNRGHGMPYEGIIECDAADTGRLLIDRRIITAFPDTFRWEICAGRDCPLSQVMRYRVGIADTARGKAALVVGNGRQFWVLHRPPR